MTDPDFGRPGSAAAGYHASPIPSSPRPGSRASRSSLRRERQDNVTTTTTNPQPSSVAQLHSQPQSPQPPRLIDDPARPPSLSPQPTLPSFSPIFALVTSSTYPSQRPTTHHPTIHYIFADDDPELLTEALARHHDPDSDPDSDQTRPRERAIVLDMVPTDDGLGFDVGSANSLSSDWAVVNAHVSRMEGVDGALAGPHGDGRGAPILHIEGVGIAPSPTPVVSAKTPTPEGELQSSGASGAKPPKPQQAAEEYADLIADFEKRMEVLRRVVKAGDERQQVADAVRHEGYREEPAAKEGEEDDRG